MPLVSLSDIETTTKTALERHGAHPWIAAEVAKAVRKAEAIGNRICGLYYLESYCRQLSSGRVKGDVEPVVTRRRLGAVVVDAQYGFAQPAFARAAATASGRASDDTWSRLARVAQVSRSHAHGTRAKARPVRGLAQPGGARQVGTFDHRFAADGVPLGRFGFHALSTRGRSR